MNKMVRFIGKINPVVLLLALSSVIIHLVFIKNLEYHRDELLLFIAKITGRQEMGEDVRNLFEPVQFHTLQAFFITAKS
jgi:hypothetical protein